MANVLIQPDADGNCCGCRESPCDPCGCACPEGLADTYCIPDPFDSPNLLTIERIGDCVWCGYSAGAEDERQKYELSIAEDIDGEGTCGWALGIAEGSLVLVKAWDDGDPLGTYTGETTTTVTAGPGNPVIPCEEATCPPFGAPTHVAATFSATGTVLGCDTHDVDIAFSGGDTIAGDLTSWEGDEVDCVAAAITGSFEIVYTCPDGCGVDTLYREFSVSVTLAYHSGSWFLAITGEPDAALCGGAAGFIQDFVLDIGADPSGTHHIEVDSSNGNTQWVIDVTIT